MIHFTIRVAYRNIIVVIFIFVSSGCVNTESEYNSEIPQHVNELENIVIHNSIENHPFTIRIISDKIFGNTEDVIIGIIGGVEVDDEGKVYLVDTKQNTIHIYNSNGTHLKSAGRHGFGPDEFRNIVYTAIRSNHLYAFDWEQQLIHVFSTGTFDYLSSIKPAENSHRIVGFEGGHTGEFFVRKDSTFLMSFIKPRDVDKSESHQFYLVNYSGEIISDKIIEQTDIRYQYQLPVAGIIVVLPFYRKPLILISNDNYILTACTEEILIKRFNPKGKYLSAFYYPFHNVDIDIEEIKNRYDSPQAKNAIQNASFTETTWPAINEILIDTDNNLWISTIVEDFDIYEWWVLEETGELLTKFEWPRDEPIEVVKNGYIYTRETDEVTGLQQVMRYRIEMQEE